MNCGEAYFTQLKILANVIISKSAEKNSINNSLLSYIKDAIDEDIIKIYYKTINLYVRRFGLEKVVYKKSNYRGIHKVFSEFCY